jgi:NAD(P)-dependent dehydrogenase (short-subunit alcohol dehydrogenase family)
MTQTEQVRAPIRVPSPEALAGARVLVIGGGSGTGAAAARMLAGVGARVLVATRSGTLPAGVVAGSGDGQVRAVAVDMLDEAALRAAVGGEELDHVVVTAAEVAAGPVLDTPYDQVETTISGWLRGSYTTARVTAPLLPPGGSITFFSGYSAARPLPGWGAGAAGGAGIEALARVLSVELAPRGVRVNTVRPGATDTGLLRGLLGGADDAAIAGMGATLPLGRVGRPEEVASAALFLMANPYVTGTVVTVDGGASHA